MFNAISRRCIITAHSTGPLLSKVRFLSAPAPDTSMPVNNRVLCVAEKNDAAKNIARILAHQSNSQVITRDGKSLYNKLYCFEANYLNGRASVVFTSVSGHLMACDYAPEYRKWTSVSDLNTLFALPVVKYVPENMQKVEATLREQARGCPILVVWTDCDREGENIGAEIADVCRRSNPRISVFRAKFSEITSAAINRAMNDLAQLHQPTVDAVDCRSELDLRIGAAFTRLQTIHLQRSFPAAMEKKVVSYGSCQFPTLGFVVERFKEIQEFSSEPFWRLVGKDSANAKVDFLWERVRLFDENVVKALHDLCMESKTAKIVMVDKHPKSKWRPVAMDTIALEKLGIRYLRMSAKKLMEIAEKLYARGYISYPREFRTETDIFPAELALPTYIQAQVNSPDWGPFAREVLDKGPRPRNGKKSDRAHPPIHPLKSATKQELVGDEWRVYELVVKHFLACLSWDARGQETKLKVEVGGENFTATGLMIEDLGYMRVYPYDKWSEKVVPNYQLHQVIPNFSVSVASGKTEPPKLLTEDELIALMDKHGIGTDATHAEHIEKIQARDYASKNRENRFQPNLLGLVLVDAYNSMGYNMVKPTLRANLETGLVDIVERRRTKNEVLQEQIDKYRRIFIETENRIGALSTTFRRYRDAGGLPAANNMNNPALQVAGP